MNEQNTGRGIHTLTDKENTQNHRRLQTSSCTFHLPTEQQTRMFRHTLT